MKGALNKASLNNSVYLMNDDYSLIQTIDNQNLVIIFN
jgi:hypothetical protein